MEDEGIRVARGTSAMTEQAEEEMNKGIGNGVDVGKQIEKDLLKRRREEVAVCEREEEKRSRIEENDVSLTDKANDADYSARPPSLHIIPENKKSNLIERTLTERKEANHANGNRNLDDNNNYNNNDDGEEGHCQIQNIDDSNDDGILKATGVPSVMQSDVEVVLAKVEIVPAKVEEIPAKVEEIPAKVDVATTLTQPNVVENNDNNNNPKTSTATTIDVPSWQQHEYVLLRPVKQGYNELAAQEGGTHPVMWSAIYIATGMKLSCHNDLIGRELNCNDTISKKNGAESNGIVKSLWPDNGTAIKYESSANDMNRNFEHRNEIDDKTNGNGNSNADITTKTDMNTADVFSNKGSLPINDVVTSFKGYRMVRSTHAISAPSPLSRNNDICSINDKSNGAWYFELVIRHLGRSGHCRVGFSTASAELGAPVGYDKHSYAYRDLCGTKVHMGLRETYGEVWKQKNSTAPKLYSLLGQILVH